MKSVVSLLALFALCSCATVEQTELAETEQSESKPDSGGIISISPTLPPPMEFDEPDLNPEQELSFRCASIFVSILSLQELSRKHGPNSGDEWPDLKEAGALRFIVQTMSELASEFGLSREESGDLLMAGSDKVFRDSENRTDRRKAECLELLEAEKE